MNFKGKTTDDTTSSNRVTLTTIHKSKGLEWEIVFLIGLNDDFFPGTNKDKEEEEERRVFYVGVTRAKKRLQMSFIWSKKNQNITRFISEVNEKLYTGYTQPLIKEQTKCNEQMRQIEKIKSKTVMLPEIIEFLNRDHYESLRNLGVLDFKKETLQIHFKCSLGQYILENNLVPEFALFFKTYMIRSIGEQFLKEMQQQQQGHDDKSKIISQAFDNKYCQCVLFSQANMAAAERNEEQKVSFAADSKLLSNQYISELSKCEEILKSLIAFQDNTQNSDSILKHIYNVSMCQSIYNQRKRLLHKEDAFKHFEFNKNILKNGKKQFIPELFKENPSSSLNLSVNETLFSESFQMKCDFDIVTSNKIYEIRFQQNSQIKPEDSIELFAKVAILEEAWKCKINVICIYYPLQGEITTIDLKGKEQQLHEVLKLLHKVRQDKQEACSVGSKSVCSNESQLNISQQFSQSFIQLVDSAHKKTSSNEERQDEGPRQKSQSSIENMNNKLSQNSIIPFKPKKTTSLYAKYGEEPYDADLYEDFEYLSSEQKARVLTAQQNEREYLNLPMNEENISQGNFNTKSSQSHGNNVGFIKASDIAGAKSAVQSKKSIVSQQKCINKITLNTTAPQPAPNKLNNNKQNEVINTQKNPIFQQASKASNPSIVSHNQNDYLEDGDCEDDIEQPQKKVEPILFKRASSFEPQFKKAFQAVKSNDKKDFSITKSTSQDYARSFRTEASAPKIGVSAQKLGIIPINQQDSYKNNGFKTFKSTSNPFNFRTNNFDQI